MAKGLYDQVAAAQGTVPLVDLLPKTPESDAIRKKLQELQDSVTQAETAAPIERYDPNASYAELYPDILRRQEELRAAKQAAFDLLVERKFVETRLDGTDPDGSGFLEWYTQHIANQYELKRMEIEAQGAAIEHELARESRAKEALLEYLKQLLGFLQHWTTHANTKIDTAARDMQSLELRHATSQRNAAMDIDDMRVLSSTSRRGIVAVAVLLFLLVIAVVLYVYGAWLKARAMSLFKSR